MGRFGGLGWASVAGAFLALLPSTAFAHGATTGKPGAWTVLTAWEFDPLIIFPTVMATWAYFSAVRSVNRAHPNSKVPAERVAYFLCGIAALVLALMSPIARYDTDLFSVHMVQHMLLIFVAVPFLLMAQPITLILRVSTPSFRKRVVLPVLHSGAVRALSFPVFTWGLLTAVLWATHFSSLFDIALENIWWHRFEHVAYIGAALLFWWPVIGADPSPWRMNHPLRLFYIFLQMPQNSFLAVSIANSTTVIFPHYASGGRTWGPSALADQEWAGYIMWVIGDLAFLVVLAALAYGWVQHEDREAKRGDRARAREKARVLVETGDGGRVAE